MRERLVADINAELAQVQAKGNILSGYASVFDYPIDAGGGATTYVRRGAFTRTLKNNRDQIQSLFNHGHDSRYGELPIGTVQKLEEDKRGLYAEVNLHDGPDNENIRAALRSGALRAMSIQFEDLTPAEQVFNEDRTERNIREVKLWEFGPVTFPANAAATASLHSIAGFAVELQDQPEVLEVEARASTLDETHLAWLLEHASRDARELFELEAMAARMALLKGK